MSVGLWAMQADAVLREQGINASFDPRVERVRVQHGAGAIEVHKNGGSVRAVNSLHETLTLIKVLSARELLTLHSSIHVERIVAGEVVGRIKMLPAEDVPRMSGSVLIDKQIAALCCGPHPMLTPYEPKLVRTFADGRKIPSYGQSSCGYDVRCEPVWRPFKKEKRGDKPMDPMDPSTFDNDKVLEQVKGDTYVLKPGECVLSVTVERFDMPLDVFARCLGKSTWARLCIVVNVTPLEPGWQGTLVMELSNTGNRSVLLRAGVGIAQIVFERLSERPDVTYADRGGKYQHQVGVQAAKA